MSAQLVVDVRAGAVQVSANSHPDSSASNASQLVYSCDTSEMQQRVLDMVPIIVAELRKETDQHERSRAKTPESDEPSTTGTPEDSEDSCPCPVTCTGSVNLFVAYDITTIDIQDDGFHTMVHARTNCKMQDIRGWLTRGGSHNCHMFFKAKEVTDSDTPCMVCFLQTSILHERHC